MSIQRGNKNSDAIRILQRDRDASARATHLKAGLGIVSRSTIERKIMSTKTSIKRIALVAAAALTLGGFSAVSANAYVPAAAYTTMYDTTNGYQVVGGQATVTIGFDTSTVATVVSTGVGSIVSAAPVAQFGLGVETVTALSASGFQHNTASGVAGYTKEYDSITVVLTSSVAGTQTLTITPLNAAGSPGTAVTKTITWTASGTTAAASFSMYLIDTTTGITAASQKVDSTVPLSKDKGSASVPANLVQIIGQLKDANGNGVSGATVSVTTSGPGLIFAAADDDGLSATNTTATSRVASVTTIAGGYVSVFLSGSGEAGVSTVTLTSGTVTGSRSVTFTGSVATYTLTSQTGAYAVGANGYNDTATGNAGGIKVVATDSAGGKAIVGTFYAKSSNTAVATVSAASHNLATVSADAASGGLVAGTAYIAVTGVKTGTATITIQNTDPAGTTAPTVTKTIDIVVTAGSAASVAFSTDKGTYSPGEPGTLNITLKNADGTAVADGSYTIFAAATPLISNLYLTGNSTGANTAWSSGLTTVSTVGGVASYDFYAPSVSSGTLTFSATTISGTTVSAALTSAARALPLTVSATISGGGDSSSLAYDAASAATDAANNAYEEAQNATQAASDALAAVKALAVQVKALMATLKAIQLKVKA